MNAMSDKTRAAEPALISVIIPIYNIEPYLRECVDSVINQTHKNLEIILVDDGSSDNCPHICDAYAAKDSRIKVIHQKNGGLGPARNSGLDIATGDYIGFVDSDDLLAPDMYEVLLGNMIAANADVSVCAFAWYYKDQPPALNDENNTFVIDLKPHPLAQAEQYYLFSACNKLYKRYIFETLRYPNSFSEDMYIYPQIVYNAGVFVVTGKTLYFYRQRRSGIWHGKPNPRIGEFIAAARHVHDFIAEHCPADLPVARYILYNHYFHVMNMLQSAPKADDCKTLPLYKETKRYLKRNAWQIIRQKATPRRTKLKALCFWLNENLYAWFWRRHSRKEQQNGFYE
jgi:glycosyltransferase involved in cell wall biosynthesis